MSPAGLCGSGGGRAESGAPRRPLSWPLPPVPLGDGEKKRVLRGKVFLRSRSCTFRGGGRAGSGVRSRPRPAVPGKPRRKVPGSVRLRRPPRRCVRGAGRACGCAPGDAPLCVQRFCVSEAAPCCGWLSLSAGPCRSWSIRSVAIPWRREGGEPTTPESGRGDLVALEESSRWGRRCRQEYPQGETWLVTWSELRRSESEIDGVCVCVCVCLA